MRVILTIAIILLNLSGYSSERLIFSLSDTNQVNIDTSPSLLIDSSKSEKEPVKFKRLKLALLTLFLGHFGVHRIYLGTKANVPVVYSLTLGGGLGILPLIDLAHILFTKDLSKYENSDKVIMWSGR